MHNDYNISSNTSFANITASTGATDNSLISQGTMQPHPAGALILHAHKLASALTGHAPSSSSLGSSSTPWPPNYIDPNDEDYPYNSPGYNPTIVPSGNPFSLDPSSQDGINNPLSKFLDMLTWLQNNPGNKLAAQAILLYADNANNAQINALMNQKNGGKNPMSLQGAITDMMNHFTPPYTKNGCLDASAVLAEDLKHVNLGKLAVTGRTELTNQLFQQVKNPFLALIFLTMMMGVNENQNQLAGYGNTSNALTKGNNQASALAAQFAANGFQSDDITEVRKFAKELYDLQNNADKNPALSGLKEALKGVLGPLLEKPLLDGNKTMPGTTTPNPNYGKPVPGETILTALKNPTQNADLRFSLQQWSSPTITPDATTANPSPIPTSNPDFTTWMNNFKTVQSSFSNQSQTVTTAVSQLTNAINGLMNSINGIATQIQQVIHTAVQQQMSQ